MNILGIHEWGHETSSSLIRKGSVTAVEEERFSRIKHQNGFSFGGSAPVLSIEFCLKSQGICLDEIDIAAIPWKFSKAGYIGFVKRGMLNILKRQSTLASYTRYRNIVYGHTIGIIKRKRFLNQFNNLNFVKHHLAHASSSYRLSNFKKSNIIVVDAAGEDSSTSLFIGNEEIELYKSFPAHNSLGQLYSYITCLLGLGKFGEGKTMALSSFGAFSNDFAQMLKTNKAGYYVDWDFVRKLKKYKRINNGILKKEHKDIAATLQVKMEEALLNLSRKLYEITGYKSLCLAGGVALNCKINSVLLNSDCVKNMFITPAPNDAGTSLGAALEIAYQNGIKVNKLGNNYFGPCYTDKGIKNTLSKYNNKIKYESYDNIGNKAAELISKGKIIGWFQSKLEFGPRALGNRSILADPTNRKIKDMVNKLKHREAWQPLAPSILENKMIVYFDDPHPSPFMSLVFQVKEDRMNEIPAVAHVDESARVQTVSKANNPRFHMLIKEFEKITGIPLLLNTSFNDKGQPIICSPDDAIETFLRMKLDYLVIGDWLISSNHNNSG